MALGIRNFSSSRYNVSMQNFLFPREITQEVVRKIDSGSNKALKDICRTRSHMVPELLHPKTKIYGYDGRAADIW